MQISYNEAGILENTVLITQFGKTHCESGAAEAKSPGQAEHIWISKEASEGGLELIIFEQSQSQGNSQLINNSSPMGKVM